MMGPEARERLEFLKRGECVPPSYIRDYYGLDWPFAGDLAADFETWKLSRARRAVACEDHEVSRIDIEAFLGRNKLVTSRWMAARLGMTVESLDRLLGALARLGMQRKRYEVYPEVISDSLSDDIVPNLPGLRFRIFGDQEAFCARFHAELREKLQIEINELWCATSIRLEDDPKLYAHDFDCLTLEPLSIKHQMWLDFRKPLYLPPDRCSKLLYVENRQLLNDCFAGSGEPEDLFEYERLLTTPSHG